MFIISLICEISRVPFDFYEGESELVSGLNIEYNSWFFIYVYMVEYLDLVFVRFLVTYFYLGGVKWFLIRIYVLLILILILVMRGRLIRFRYDKIIILIWLYFLPSLVGLIIIFRVIYIY